jgi:hypothetical protein
MAKLGDGHIVWDLTDPGVTLAKARDALASHLRDLPSLPRGQLRQWLGNALANRTLVCRRWRVYETKPETTERELKLYRFVNELRQQPITRELCDRISSTVRRSSAREERHQGRTVVYIEYFGHRIDFELKLTIGRVMRMEDAVAYAAYRCGFGIKSAYNTFSAYRARDGRPLKKADRGHAEPLEGLSPAERDIVPRLLTEVVPVSETAG